MSETPAPARLRRAVRAIILADDDRVLLCRLGFPHPAVPAGATVVRAAPGGGIEPGELPDRRASLGGGQRGKVPVPVWLTLGGWDPVTTSLHRWAVGTMNRDQPALLAADFGPDAAGELLRGGRVALFLDGLDEMPGGLRARALTRVGEEAPGLRVVVTSRPEPFRRLAVGKPRLPPTAPT